MTDWRDISTAPKDGTRVDIWLKPHDAAASGNAHRRIDAYFMGADWWFLGNSGQVFVVASHHWEVTHWMPRPAAPGSPVEGDLVGLEQAAADLLAAADKDDRTVGYRKDLWECLRSCLASPAQCCRGLAPKSECKCEQDGIADLMSKAHEQAKALGAGYLRANPDGSLELLDPASVYFKIQPVEPSLENDALDALRKWNAAFEGLFAHCVSNGVFNQWGKRMNCTALNEAHETSDAVLRRAGNMALPPS